MSKQKKKRNKPYRGQDAKTIKPSIVRVSAKQRNPLSQWLVERKRLARPALIAFIILVVIIFLGVGLASLLHG